MPRTASANGKVILFGEYAVLSGITGYAVALKDFKLSLTISDSLNNCNSPNLDAILEMATIDSNIPQGSGLGSSAALSVALARALSSNDEDPLSIAKGFEDELHGGSSGLDTFTVNSGGLCSISSGNTFTKLPGIFLERLRPFKFSIIDTNTSRSVREIKSQISKLDLEEFLPLADEISRSFQYKLENDQLKLPDMVELFNRAQSALVKLKISTPLIDSITEIVMSRFPLVGVKITGAGGGGCLLLVHNENVQEYLFKETLGVINGNIKIWYDIEFME